MVRGTSLKILGLVSSDAGIYQCIGRNQAGSVQASAQLRVESKGKLNLLFREEEEAEGPRSAGEIFTSQGMQGINRKFDCTT